MTLFRGASPSHLGTGKKAGRGTLLSLFQLLPHPLGASLGPHLPVYLSFDALGLRLGPRPRLDMVPHISSTSLSSCFSAQVCLASWSLAGVSRGFARQGRREGLTGAGLSAYNSANHPIPHQKARGEFQQRTVRYGSGSKFWGCVSCQPLFFCLV